MLWCFSFRLHSAPLKRHTPSASRRLVDRLGFLLATMLEPYMRHRPAQSRRKSILARVVNPQQKHHHRSRGAVVEPQPRAV